LIMSVNPGFGGQKFIPGSFEKVMKLDKMKKDQGLDFIIEIDGGLSSDNAKQAFDAGVNIIVAGNSVFNSSNPAKAIADIKKV